MLPVRYPQDLYISKFSLSQLTLKFQFNIETKKHVKCNIIKVKISQDLFIFSKENDIRIEKVLLHSYDNFMTIETYWIKQSEGNSVSEKFKSFKSYHLFWQIKMKICQLRSVEDIMVGVALEEKSAIPCCCVPGLTIFGEGNFQRLKDCGSRIMLAL